jgi:hypothetical protein
VSASRASQGEGRSALAASGGDSRNFTSTGGTDRAALERWGNAYALVYLLWPESFRVADGIAWQLGDWHLQRFLFNYFSVMTLTTAGYDDIIPAGSPVYSLLWLEAVFGQFYIAVVVAQLVGLKLAQTIKQDRPDS